MKKKLDHNPDLDRLPDWVGKFKLGSKGPTVKQLLDSGFCRVQASADVSNCIARLDKKDWLDYVHVEFPGSHNRSLAWCADIFRTRLGKGFRNVPQNILAQLPLSEADDAPTEFRYHWTYRGPKVEVEPEGRGRASPQPAKKPVKKAAQPAKPAPAAAPEPASGFDTLTTSSGEHLQVSHEAMMAAIAELPELPPVPAPAVEPEPDQHADVEDADWEEVKKPEPPRPLPPREPVSEMPFGTANGAADPLNGLETTAMKVVVVTFTPTGAQEYFYFAPVDTVVGDYAVVYRKASENATNPFSIGLIERDDPDLEGKARASILGVFNEDFANSVQARMDQLVQIKARLIQKRRQYDERQIYELMAGADPEARELLDMLKRLEGEL